jgi:hypothetical protein
LLLLRENASKESVVHLADLTNALFFIFFSAMTSETSDSPWSLTCVALPGHNVIKLLSSSLTLPSNKLERLTQSCLSRESIQRNPYIQGKVSMVDLLVLTGSEQLLFKLKEYFYKTIYLNEAVKCTEPSTSARVPCPIVGEYGSIL